MAKRTHLTDIIISGTLPSPIFRALITLYLTGEETCAQKVLLGWNDSSRWQLIRSSHSMVLLSTYLTLSSRTFRLKRLDLKTRNLKETFMRTRPFSYLVLLNRFGQISLTASRISHTNDLKTFSMIAISPPRR